jgi:hypothetical protein
MTLVAGALGGIGGALVRRSRQRARRRDDAREEEFSRASSGMWPPVPRANSASLRIEADRATAPSDAADEQPA